MSRHLIGLSGYGLGDSTGWYALYASPSEVYLWRAELTGAPLRDPSDALALVRAVGANQDLNLDVRGIAIGIEDAHTTVDVVLSTGRERFYPPGLYDDADDIGRKLVNDASLRERFPALQVSKAELLELTGPPDAVDFWRAHPTLWSVLLGQTGHGGPTADFALGRGVYLGRADDGPRLRAWTAPEPGLGPAKADQDYAALWVMGGLVLAWLVVRAL